MVFQFPESQLFEDTVEREMIFGPKNFKMDLDEAKNYAHRLLMDLGFSRDVMSQSPFQMSGGQMRKIAIVSVLAMNPILSLSMNLQLDLTHKANDKLCAY